MCRLTLVLCGRWQDGCNVMAFSFLSGLFSGVEDGKMAVLLYDTSGTQDVCINEFLVQNGYCQPAGLGYVVHNREVKHDVYGKRQTAKMKVFPSVFSSLYRKIKIFVFAVNSKRHISIFV